MILEVVILFISVFAKTNAVTPCPTTIRVSLKLGNSTKMIVIVSFLSYNFFKNKNFKKWKLSKKFYPRFSNLTYICCLVYSIKK